MSSYPRPEPQLSADERTTLEEYLDYHRITLLRQAEGLSDEQLRIRLAPSSMTIGGLLSHMAWVENWWFDEILDANPPAEVWAEADWENDSDWEWSSAADKSGDELRALFSAAVERAKQQVSGRSLDDVSERNSRHSGQPFSVRWMFVHMIEEYARHCGHADLIRESIDGTTGL